MLASMHLSKILLFWAAASGGRLHSLLSVTDERWEGGYQSYSFSRPSASRAYWDEVGRWRQKSVQPQQSNTKATKRMQDEAAAMQCCAPVPCTACVREYIFKWRSVKSVIKCGLSLHGNSHVLSV
jgi:hypothetical protein